MSGLEEPFGRYFLLGLDTLAGILPHSAGGRGGAGICWLACIALMGCSVTPPVCSGLVSADTCWSEGCLGCVTRECVNMGVVTSKCTSPVPPVGACWMPGKGYSVPRRSQDCCAFWKRWAQLLQNAGDISEIQVHNSNHCSKTVDFGV